MLTELRLGKGGKKMIVGNVDEDKAEEREDMVSHLTIECAVTIHPVQGRDTSLPITGLSCL